LCVRGVGPKEITKAGGQWQRALEGETGLNEFWRGSKKRSKDEKSYDKLPFRGFFQVVALVTKVRFAGWSTKWTLSSRGRSSLITSNELVRKKDNVRPKPIGTTLSWPIIVQKSKSSP